MRTLSSDDHFRAPRRLPVGALGLTALGAALLGCLDRRVAEIDPLTTNVAVEQITIDQVDKLDFVFMIDNSKSMADKQEILGAAVPELMRRFVVPLCVDGAGAKTAQRSTADEPCPPGSAPEFKPIDDIHIAVISSSLGAHGGAACSPAMGRDYDPSMDDRGRPVALQRTLEPITQVHPLGFLEWRGGDAVAIEAFIASFRDVVLATGEAGCGYEASLEAWYRFLIDPEPPLEVLFDATSRQTVAQGVDAELLAMRAEFLRPDSLVAVIMLSDENDCSMRDDGVSWLVTGGDGTKTMPRGRAVCRTNPDDPCCTSCADRGAEERCGPAEADAECALDDYPTSEDNPNLRCFDQKRRFGIDFLYPVERYSDALTAATITGRSGKAYPNPLYSESLRYPELAPRVPGSLVYLAGLVGVPWQDIATPESLSDPARLVYKRGGEIDWSAVLGDPELGALPGDPFMRESIDPRSGQNPITLDSILPESSPVPADMAQPSASGSWINGHEYTGSNRNDLQFACIFPLAPPRPCPDPEGRGCDCAGSTYPPDSPLCQSPGTVSSGSVQYFAKAYPGLRFLDVLERYDTNSIVASVCPKIIDPTHQYGGYNPAVAAIVDRLKVEFRGTCMPRPLRIGSDGNVLCKVVEATVGQGITCSAPVRSELEASVAAPVRKRLQERGLCGIANRPACEEYTLCKIEPLLQGTPEHGRCLDDLADDVGANGYCYIDATVEPGIGNPELVKNCDPTEKRMLRFVRTVSDPVPAERSSVFIACLGDAAP